MPEWIETTIGNVITLQRGYDITRAIQRPGDVPVVSSGGVSSTHDSSISDGPGVVMGRKGTLGKVFYLPGPYWPHDTTLWVKDFKGSSPRFVYYFLQTLDLVGLDVGSSNPTLNRNHIHPLVVRWPTRATQDAIAEVLAALDDKIEVNARIADTGDALRAAIIGRARAETPTDLVARPLSEIASFINGRAFTKDATGTGRMVIRIAEINSGPGPSTVYNDITADEKYLARPGDILFAWSGSLTVARWYRPEAIINQHIFKVVPALDAPPWLVFDALKSKLAQFQDIAASKATTMGHIQRHHLDETVLVPGADTIGRLHRSASSLWYRALAAEQESLTLMALRDTLLPDLISGRLQVGHGAKAVEQAL